MEKMALKLKAEHSKEKFIKNMVDELGRDVTVVKNKYIPENTIIVGTETYEGFNKAFNPEKLIKENEDVIKKSGFKSWTFTNGTVSGTVDGGCCS